MATNGTAQKKIAIVGCGLIGSSWATLFASAGYLVSLYDIDKDAISAAKARIMRNLQVLEENGLLRGPGNAKQQFSNITVNMDLSLCLKDAVYCQESVGENIDIKKDIFAKMDELISADTVVGSSTSAIPSSTFVKDLKNRSRYIVAHPINPPLFVRLVEIVPNQWTSKKVVNFVRDIMETLGQKPVEVCKELPGFVLNRIQYAIIEESWRLVKDGVLTPEDVDTVMTEGLGCRYAFFGPFEVMHLNANGIDDYMNRYMAGVGKVVNDFGPHPSFTEPEVKKLLSSSLNKKMPVSELSTFHQEREKRLIQLIKLKSTNGKQD